MEHLNIITLYCEGKNSRAWNLFKNLSNKQVRELASSNSGRLVAKLLKAEFQSKQH